MTGVIGDFFIPDNKVQVVAGFDAYQACLDNLIYESFADLEMFSDFTIAEEIIA